MHAKLIEAVGEVKSVLEQAAKGNPGLNSHEKSAVIYCEVLARLLSQAKEAREVEAKLLELGNTPPPVCANCGVPHSPATTASA